MSAARERRRVRVGENWLHYTLVRSRRRRHSHLIMDDLDGLQLRVPVWMPPERADALVVGNAAWVESALDRQQQVQARKAALQSGTELPFLDETLVLSVSAAHRWSVRRQAQQLRLCGPGAPVNADDEAARAALERWYRKQAGQLLWPRLQTLGAAHGLHAAGISIRAQRTRWGSCSRNGRINLNWRLMLLPAALADYVLMHELCHLRHMNHSPAFWALLGAVMPDFEAREQRLNAIRSAEMVL